jgi:hypothetical protein
MVVTFFSVVFFLFHGRATAFYISDGLFGFLGDAFLGSEWSEVG